VIRRRAVFSHLVGIQVGGGLTSSPPRRRILAEAQAATEEIHPGIDAGKRFAQMREAFDSLVSGWEELEGGLSLPDEDDQHVLAAAIRGVPVVLQCSTQGR
jgi:hypothetical protein